MAHWLKLGLGPDRRLGPQGDTCAEFARYINKPVGNNVEISPLDSHCFAYYKHDILTNIALTRSMDSRKDPDKKKFSLGSPDQVWSAMYRTWKECAPTSEQIVRDIQHIPKAIDMVIAAQGAIVKEVDTHRGRRETLQFVPHPDCAEAIAAAAEKYDAWEEEDNRN